MERRAAVRSVLRWAALWGLVAGFMESVARSLLPWAPPFRIHLGGYLWWMPAVGNMVWFLVVGGGIALLAAAWPRLVTPRVVNIPFGWLGFLNLLVLFSPPLHRAAAMILALGLAIAVSRWLESHPARRDMVGSRGAILLGLVAALIAVGVEASRAVGERRALAAPAAGATSPNVLLLVLDNVRGQNLSAYGYFRPTSPALAGLARRGVLFERAYATSSWSLPSHASLMTGRWAHELEASWRVPLGASHRTLAEVFAGAGYATGGFVANGAYTQRETGLSQGFGRYEDYPLTVPQVLMSSRFGLMMSNLFQRHVWRLPGPPSDIWHRRSAADLHERLLRWIDRQQGRPFLGFVNYFDAHVPYYAPPDLLPFADPPVGDPAGPVDLSLPFSPAASNELYDRAILGMDREIGRLLDALASRGLLDRTILVVTSDHGEEFEEHGVFGHGNTLYEAVLRIPLIVVRPGAMPAGIRVANPVSLRDVPATLVDLAGIPAPGLPGCSLADHWRMGGATRLDTLFAGLRKGINTDPSYPVSRGDMISVLVGPWHFIRNGDGVAELYDLGSDPWEQRNLAGQPATSGIEATLSRLAASPPNSTACAARP